MAPPLSPETRAATLARLPAERLDLLVVGGGITGAGIARDAALRGLVVALIERTDFAAGTSSRSSKLIHGGVRYLEQGDVALVRESATERQVLRRLAPHLTAPLRMVMPTYGRAMHAKLAAGPWADEARALAGARGGPRLHLTKGIHLVVPHARLPVRHAVVMQARDRRSVFAVPRDGATYIGTTDTDHGPPVDHPEVTAGD